MPIPIAIERRRARASRRSEALHLLLCRTREKLRARALTLGSVSGSLLVGVGASGRQGEDLARVAALGADVNAGKEVSERVATWHLHVGEADFLLTSLGGVMDADLGAGVRRIILETTESL